MPDVEWSYGRIISDSCIHQPKTIYLDARNPHIYFMTLAPCQQPAYFGDSTVHLSAKAIIWCT